MKTAYVSVTAATMPAASKLVSFTVISPELSFH
jgi:hypothetical protein